MLRMASAMQGLGGASPFGGAPFGAPQPPAFPAPGTPTTAAGQAAATTTPASAPGSPQANPFALFNPAVGAGAPGAVGAGAAGAGTGAQPFGGLDPAMMQQMLGMGGPFGGGAGAGGLGAYGGFGPFGGAAATPAAPADTRSPEERFQVQLQVCFLFSLYGGTRLIGGLATARHGVHERGAERARAARDGRECAGRDRLHIRRRRAVSGWMGC